MYDEGLELLKEIDAILNDINLDDEDLLVAIDMSLMDYFNKHKSRIVFLSKELQERRTLPFNLMGKKYILLGSLLDWMFTRFYDAYQEDEERIRVWTNNVKEYRERRNNLVHK